MTDQQQPRRGGRRPGAGRPKLSPGQKRTMQEIYMAPATWHAVSAYRARKGTTTSAVVEQLVRQALGLPLDGEQP